MKNYSPINGGDEVTVRQVIEKTVTASATGDNINYTGCFSATDGQVYHLDGHCALSSTEPQWQVVKVSKTVNNWPPQEDDVWKAGMYTMHFFNREFHFKNAYSDTTTTYTVEQVKDMNPGLIFRKDKKK